MAIATFAISGDRQLTRKLMRLPSVVQRKLAKSALSKGARPIVMKARANILPTRRSKKREREWRTSGRPMSVSGRLRKSIGFVFRMYRTSGKALVVIGPRYPLGAHGHLVEFGTAGLRPHPRTGTSGKMPSLPFLRPAWDAMLPMARRIIGAVLGAGIIAEAKK